MSQNPENVSASQPSGYRWLALLMLTIVYTFNFIDRQLLVILSEPIKAELALSDAQLGLLTGFSFAVIYVVAGIPIGHLADRSNRRNIVALSLAFWSAMTALSGLVQNYAQLVLARFGVGLGEAGGSPPAHSMLSDYFPPQQRGTAISVYSMGIYIGILLGYMGGGYMAEAVGWRQAFFVIGIPGVAFAGLLVWWVREPVRGFWEAGVVAEKASFAETIATLRQRSSFWWIALAAAFMSLVGYGNGNFMPSYLIRNHGMSVGEVGFVLGLLSGIAGAIGTVLGGVLADKMALWDRRWYVWLPMLASSLSIPPAAYALLGDDPRLIILALLPANILNAMYLGPCIALGQTLVTPRMRAVASAIMLFIINMIGLGLGPLLVGLLSDYYASGFGSDNLRYAMLTMLAAGQLGLFFFWLGQRRLLADLDATAALARASAHR
ncbi:major facilitator superfamily protein [Luminiphilus syltensis NOR5-1B]|uniref:Major facilitator superfamily protein n=1 Tax=Luminiphilus syltensis NOR5-1B TaxID=565045 RepID=B8KRP4_9GAMM|nr:MFS transporter [Luminiphilus syltensis]EED36215.1 major facilitator superfamily protein [Luminiphilus syltensis NOR5-1B]